MGVIFGPHTCTFVVHYVLPRLSYAYGDLEPFVDRATLQIHHTSHHQSYVDGLNATLMRIGANAHPAHISSILSDMSAIPEAERADVAYFGGGFENHRLLWATLKPPGIDFYDTDGSVIFAKDGYGYGQNDDVLHDSTCGSNNDDYVVDTNLDMCDQNGSGSSRKPQNTIWTPDTVAGIGHSHTSLNNHFGNDRPLSGVHNKFAMPKPCGTLADAIDVYLGGFDSFQKIFAKRALSITGSGWCWLALDPTYNKLLITTTKNNDNPRMFGLVPLLGLDLWEHAYYIKYKDDRIGYLNGWWHVINWRNVEGRFSSVVM